MNIESWVDIPIVVENQLQVQFIKDFFVNLKMVSSEDLRYLRLHHPIYIILRHATSFFGAGLLYGEIGSLNTDNVFTHSPAITFTEFKCLVRQYKLQRLQNG